MPKFYITTTLPYVNSDPHVGFAKEIIFADCLARFHRLMGDEVFFNTGTDEHGQKIFTKAKESGKDTQAYVDEYADKFKGLKTALNLSYDKFIRTTDPTHKEAAAEFWKRCLDNGYIYKKNYKIKYCVGCELEKQESDLEDGKCPIHPNLNIELIDEENYFFKFSEFQEKLLKLYKDQPEFVVPDFRKNEIVAFVERGLQDFSISRLKSKMSWGVPVPGDPDQVMYVWFDALVNYVSTLGWPNDEKKFAEYWPGIQVAGKDNLRQQSAMWQAMLIAASLPTSKQIIILGFITSGGQKMSKSLGNVINPLDIVKDYGTDALRYFLLREISSFEDGDFTLERFKEAYNANLANGLGNLASRIMKMAESNLDAPVSIPDSTITEEYKDLVNKYELQKVCDYIWSEIGRLDTLIQSSQPFKLVKSEPEKGKDLIGELVVELYKVARMLEPFLPATSDAIKQAVKTNKSFSTPLFPRKD